VHGSAPASVNSNSSAPLAGKESGTGKEEKEVKGSWAEDVY